MSTASPRPWARIAALVTATLLSPAVSAFQEPADPAAAPTVSQARFQKARDVRTRRAIDDALDWLARHQSPTGAWDCDAFMQQVARPDAPPCDGAGGALNDVGVTGLALLAFLGDGHTTRHGHHAKTVARGIRWLQGRQYIETGLLGKKSGHAYLYNHALGTLALAEAYYLSRSPLLRETTRRAVHCIHAARNPYGVWRYDSPPIGDNDTSVTVWMVQALAAANDAGIEIDPQALAGARSWLEEVTDPATGRIGYDSAGSSSSRVQGVNEHFPTDRGEAITAAGVFARFLIAGAVEEGPLLEQQVALLAAAPPAWDRDGLDCDMIYWFFGSHVMAQVPGPAAEEWREALLEAVLPRQRDDGNFEGSWDPAGVWGYAGGRVYSTALMALSLEADRRHAPLPRRPAVPLPAVGRHAAAPAPEPAPPEADPEPRDESTRRPRGERRFLSRPDRPAARRTAGRALDDALAWLVEHQTPDGYWTADSGPSGEKESSPPDHVGRGYYRVGVTGLALLALIGDESARERPRTRATIERGLAWLLRQQDPDTGQIGEEVTHSHAYNHAIATLALTEACYAFGDAALRDPARRAVDHVLRARNPYGAWRYDSPPVGDNDTSVTGWMVMVLASAQDSGLEIDAEALRGALAWIDEVTDPSTGRIGYDSRGSRSSRTVNVNEHFPPERGEAMTASGLLTRFHAGQTPEKQPVMNRHADLLRKTLPAWNPQAFTVDAYYWFHGSHAMRLMGGEHWHSWSRALEPALVDSQRRDGDLAGSWDPIGPWGSYGGRAYATAMMAMSLEAFFR